MEEIKQKQIGTIIKTMKMQRNTNTKVKTDVVGIWYRDKNKEKQLLIYDKPIVDYYVIKDKNSPEASHPPLYIDKDKVEKRSAYSHEITKAIALDCNAISYYNKYRLAKGDNAVELKNVFRHNHVYSGDIDIQDYCIMDFLEKFESSSDYELHKMFFDIEVELATNNGKPDKYGNIYYNDFPYEKYAPCPINVISAVDSKTKLIYTYILRNPHNEGSVDFEKKEREYKQKLLEKIKTDFGYEVNNIVFKYFDEELDLIKGFMNLVHTIDPDFMEAWNMLFDVDTMINRAKRLLTEQAEADKAPKQKRQTTEWKVREELLEIFTNPRYRSGYTQNGDFVDLPLSCYYISELKRESFGDKKKNNDKRIDVFSITDGTNWMDALLYYRLCHDAGGKKANYKLDYIGELEVGIKKVVMDRNETIKNLGWLNYNKFMLYNIIDVVILDKLEDQVKDMDMVQKLSEILNTRKEKVFNNSISVANLFRVFAKGMGKVMNSNKNMGYKPFKTKEEKDAETFADALTQDPDKVFDSIYRTSRAIIEEDKMYSDLFAIRDRIGAFVSDPNLLERRGHEVMPGIMSMFIWRLLVDFDLTSLYPSIIIALNIDPTTLVGKFYLRDDMLKDRLKTKFDHYGCFKVSDKSADGEEEDDEIEEYDEDENRIIVRTETVVEMNDLAPTLVDKIYSGNWSRIAEQFMCIKSTDEMLDDIGNIINSRN